MTDGAWRQDPCGPRTPSRSKRNEPGDRSPGSFRFSLAALLTNAAVDPDPLYEGPSNWGAVKLGI